MNSSPPQPVSQFPSIGRWVVTVIPGGWIFLQGFGIRQMTADPNAVAASVGLGEDLLSTEGALQEYIERQKQLIGKAIEAPAFAGPQPFAFAGADEAQLFMVRHTVESAGLMTHIQTYVRQGLWLGVITLTSLNAQVAALRPDYDAFVKGLYIAPPAQAGPSTPAAEPSSPQPAA